MLFKYFDVDDAGAITKANVVSLLERLGKPISDDELNKAFD